MQKLFLFLFALLAIWYVRRLVQRGDADDSSSAPPVETRRDALRSETVRECAQCGVLVPESEGVVVGDGFYCSAEHARLAERGR
ncbi:hypothetical protein GCM10027046_16320 [Uliginosibacterium flavum]|uniref:PP0621 family protein n=1 Tax=Uliginosibacterium flavum TaxID=1396831 RepID=A0ABV2TP08_9RHOO